MKKHGILMLFALTLLSSACAYSANELNKVPEGMKVATKEMVSECEFLGDVHGVSSLYGVFAETALTKARQQAFEQTRELGGNTIVWEPFSTQHGGTSVHGNAYNCPHR